MDTLRLRLLGGGVLEITVLGEFARLRQYDAIGTLELSYLKRIPKAVYTDGVWNVFALIQFVESL